MPRPRSAPSCAAAQMQGFQPTRAWPGHNGWPNGQCCGLCSNRDTGIKMIMSLPLVLTLVRSKKLTLARGVQPRPWGQAPRVARAGGAGGDFGALVELLDPDVVLLADPERLTRLEGVAG